MNRIISIFIIIYGIYQLSFHLTWPHFQVRQMQKIQHQSKEQEYIRKWQFLIQKLKSHPEPDRSPINNPFHGRAVATPAPAYEVYFQQKQEPGILKFKLIGTVVGHSAIMRDGATRTHLVKTGDSLAGAILLRSNATEALFRDIESGKEITITK
jgi:hypothetical protein